MRPIAITLLLLNFAYLGWIVWQRSQSPVPSIPVRPATASGAPLVLLSERDATAVSRSDVAMAVLLCTQVGEFPSLEDANLFIKEARDLGLTAKLSLAGRLLEPQYRVYLPPFSSRDIAALTVNTLQGVPEFIALALESYVITRGELANGIAFGIFPDQAGAEVIRNTLGALGYAAEVGEVPRAEGAVFVELIGPDDAAISPRIWEQLLLDRPYLNRSENVC